MTGQLLLVGLSHRTAPLELRERLAFGEKAATRLEGVLLGGGAPVAQEAVVLSTCNRTELYLRCRDPLQAEGRALAILAQHGRIPPTELAGAIYALRNCEVARRAPLAGSSQRSSPARSTPCATARSPATCSGWQLGLSRWCWGRRRSRRRSAAPTSGPRRPATPAR